MLKSWNTSSSVRDRDELASRMVRGAEPEEIVMKKLLTSFVRDTEGQDLIEYALLAATIGLGALVGMRAVRNALNSEFSSISTSITSAS